MRVNQGIQTAIIDYSLGNLFSVLQACRHAGLEAFITADREEVIQADAVILPGVGAFGDAMDTLRRLDLVSPLRDIAAAGRPLLGICLGQQLLMSESCEFGQHRGLDLISGSVAGFERPLDDEGRVLKVPHVGWNMIRRPERNGRDPWEETCFRALGNEPYMYFVHSYYVIPEDRDAVLSLSSYGRTEFCSALKKGNITACQFHPERSGPAGLAVYRCWAEDIGAGKNQSANCQTAWPENSERDFDGRRL